MGTIIERKRKGGKMSHCAQIVVKRDGKTYRKSKTFASKAAARAWLKDREGDLSAPGALERRDDPKLGEVIDRYIGDSLEAMGRTKAQVLRTIKTYPIANKRCSEIDSADYVDFARKLSVQPQTRLNYLSHLSAVVAVARPAWGYPLSQQAIKDAVQVCKRLKLTAKSNKRERRPTLAELDRLMEHFAAIERDGRSAVPMTKIIPFALFSTRRQEEITRVLRTDFQPAHDGDPARALVRDMKNPGEKRGNNTWCDLPPEAAAFVKHMLTTHSHPEIFPYEPRTIGAYFTNATRMLGIEDLHFHDLRHEGVSRLFEMDTPIPRVAKVSGHKDWKSLQRYEHLRRTGDKYANWKWKTP